jgi:hypothetical protein
MIHQAIRIFTILFLSSSCTVMFSQAIKVSVQQNAEGKWGLIRGGRSYYVKGWGRTCSA